MDDSKLVVTWSAEADAMLAKREKVHVALNALYAANSLVLVAISVTRLLHIHVLHVVQLLLTTAMLSNLVALYSWARRRVVATGPEQATLEDGAQDGAVLAEAWFSHGRKFVGRDRGVLLFENEALIFVGGRCSCTIDVRKVGDLIRTHSPAITSPDPSVRFSDGQRASFRILEGRYDPGGERERALLYRIDPYATRRD